MKERPIIFSTEMVKAILDGRKTMTRRVIKPQPPFKENPFDWNLEACPYGHIGDRLWVRETWASDIADNSLKPCELSPNWGVWYKTDLITPDAKTALKWRSSIFMPRWASRLTLEITEVRVERLQEISIGDIEAEGHQPFVYPDGMQELSSAEAYSWFCHLWDSLNAKRGYGWETNPWVWVIKFDNIGVRIK